MQEFVCIFRDSISGFYKRMTTINMPFWSWFFEKTVILWGIWYSTNPIKPNMHKSFSHPTQIIGFFILGFWACNLLQPGAAPDNAAEMPTQSVKPYQRPGRHLLMLKQPHLPRWRRPLPQPHCRQLKKPRQFCRQKFTCSLVGWIVYIQDTTIHLLISDIIHPLSNNIFSVPIGISWKIRRK